MIGGKIGIVGALGDPIGENICIADTSPVSFVKVNNNAKPTISVIANFFFIKFPPVFYSR